jgi:hypothetical protein
LLRAGSTSGVVAIAVALGVMSIALVSPSAQPAQLPSAASARPPAPQSFLGFEPCADYTLATSEQTAAYFRALAAASAGRMQLVEIGRTTEGRPELMAIISSEANIRDLAKYKNISRQLALARGPADQARALAREGKAVVWIDFGLHSSEVAPAQAAALLAFNAVADESEEMRAIRDNVVLLLLPDMNPDGTTMVADWYMHNVGKPWESRLPELWHRYAGHDDNRDWFMMTQQETRNAARQLYTEWFPQIVYNQHQSGPFPARIFVPPFDDPMNPNIPPLVIRGVNLLGDAMTARLDREGKRGAVSRVGFDTWWDGGMRSTPYFHNMVGLLTETSHPSATPSFDDPKTFPKTFENGASTTEPSTSYPSPYPGGEWHLRNSCDYIVTTSMAVLDQASQARETWLYDIYQMGRDAIVANKDEAFLIPTDQWDSGAARRLVNVLRLGGVEVERATARFSAGGATYGPGTFIIRGAQPFEPYVKDLLTPQTYPDIRVAPGGPPKQPYDITGWTLSYQMGVKVSRVNESLSVATETIDMAPATAASPPDPSAARYAIDPRANDAFIAVNRLMKAGDSVLRASAPLQMNGATWPPGAFLVDVAAGPGGQNTRARIDQLATGLELAIAGAPASAAPSTRLRAPRIGLYHAWGGNIDEGWTRWVLEQFEFAFTSLHDADIRAGNLRAKYDVIVLPDATYEQMLNGLAPGSMPPEYTGGMTALGVGNLEAFVSAGGTLVALDRATSLPLTGFDLPIRNVTARLRSSDFYVPGTIVRLSVDPSAPVAYGMPAEAAAFLIHSPAFSLDSTGGGTAGTIVGRYPTSGLLMSGWLLGEQVIAGRAAVVQAALGKGQVVLLGFGVQHRGQSQGTFKLLFNSLLNSSLE